MQLKCRHGPTKQLLADKQNPSKRVESRRWYKEGFAKKMTVFNRKTVDESLLVFKKKRQKWRINNYTTNPQERGTAICREKKQKHIDSTTQFYIVLRYQVSLSLQDLVPPKVKQARINTDNETDDEHCRQTEYKYKI